jgi:DNA-binding NtrC family response regulator
LSRLEEGSIEVLLSRDDPEWASRLHGILDQEGIAGEIVNLHGDVLKQVKERRPLLLILTGSLHDRGVERLLRGLKKTTWSTSVIGLVEQTSSDDIRSLHRLGVDECLKKPVDMTEFRLVSNRLLERERMVRKTNILGRSEGVLEVLEKVKQYAPFNSTVLIQGESGTGKELVAKAIHRLSQRRHRPFIALNCAALPESILESELFGHEKGAFTGASSLRKGRFEVANTGTLFLDEVGEMVLATQVKLLRVLEEREFVRVGGTESISVDVRVITATNKDLQEEMEIGNFRRDLYYRLKVLTIDIPPLRERREDIPLLVNTFINRFCEENRISFVGVNDEAMEVLKNYDWPGNVRELKNLVENMLISSPDRKIRPEDIPDYIYRRGEPGRLLPIPVTRVKRTGEMETSAILSALVELRRDIRELGRQLMAEIHGNEVRMAGYPPNSHGRRSQDRDIDRVRGDREGRHVGGEIRVASKKTLAEIEKEAIAEALRELNGNRRQAAKMLGIGERTLYRKINAYGLR